jgi:uncharacterized protein (TIGR00369 family)
MTDVEFRPSSFSKITITELMIPAFSNFSGKIHGGILLSLMDKVAYACASKHSGKYCVTVSVDNVEFLQPVEVGEMVSMLASVNYVGNTSMIIGIKVISENFHTGTVKHTNSSYFTMVAKDEKGHPCKVPGMLLESRDDLRRFVRALKRKKLKSQYKAELNNSKTQWDDEASMEILKKEKCKIGF